MVDSGTTYILAFQDVPIYVLGAPGVVLARSLLRHHIEKLSTENRLRLIQFSLLGWRHYFDNPVFVASLRERKGQ